jgi:plasmid replication initiation protein
MKSNKQIASVSNDLVLRSKYKLTATEQKLILFMASLIKPEDTDFNSQKVPFKEIERLFNQNNTKWGNIYADLDKLLDNLTSKKITFDTDIELRGMKLKGRINWVASAVPQYDEKGQLCIEFEFSKHMKPFFLELKKNFTKYQIQDIINMNSPNSIRLYQILKTHKDKQSQYRDVAVITYSLDELKMRMGLDDQKAYNQYGNFKNRVLKTAQEQLKENTHICFDYVEKKTGRKVTDIVFSIYNNLPNATEEDLINLFSPETLNEDTQKAIEDTIFELVRRWGINRNSVEQLCKSYDKAYIEEKILYTKKMAKLDRIKSSKASFLFGALKDDYKDEKVLVTQEKVILKEVVKTNEKQVKDAKIRHQANMDKLREQLLAENPKALEAAAEASVTNRIPFGYKKDLSTIENMDKSPIFRAAVKSQLEKLFPQYFEKEIARFEKEMEVVEKQ